MSKLEIATGKKVYLAAVLDHGEYIQPRKSLISWRNMKDEVTRTDNTITSTISPLVALGLMENHSLDEVMQFLAKKMLVQIHHFDISDFDTVFPANPDVRSNGEGNLLHDFSKAILNADVERYKYKVEHLIDLEDHVIYCITFQAGVKPNAIEGFSADSEPIALKYFGLIGLEMLLDKTNERVHDAWYKALDIQKPKANP